MWLGGGRDSGIGALAAGIRGAPNASAPSERALSRYTAMHKRVVTVDRRQGDESACGCLRSSLFSSSRDAADTNWQHVGDGRGDYEMVYVYKGFGAGDFIQAEVKDPFRDRRDCCCNFIVCGCILILALISVYFVRAQHDERIEAFMNTLNTSLWSAITTFRTTVDSDPNYNCFISSLAASYTTAWGGPASMAGTAIVDGVWRATDRNEDGVINKEELESCRKGGTLSQQAYRLLMELALLQVVHHNRSGFNESQFIVTVTSAALSLYHVDRNQSFLVLVGAAIAKAAWLLADIDEDGRIREPELRLLERHLPTHQSVQLFAGNADNLNQDEFDAVLGRAGLSEAWGSSGVAAVVGAAAAGVAWDLIDSDADGQMTWAELSAWQPFPALSFQHIQAAFPDDSKPDAQLSRDVCFEYITSKGWQVEGEALVKSRMQDADLRSARVSVPWSADHRQWCCAHLGVNCKIALPKNLVYDCAVGLAQSDLGWSMGKTTWCCEHENAGCSESSTSVTSLAPPTANTTRAPWDCDTGLADWRKTWSIHQRVWCCHHMNRACPDEPLTVGRLPFANKTAAAEPLMFACKLEEASNTWSSTKAKWCCHYYGRGCPSTTTTTAGRRSIASIQDLFDCNAGYANWMHGWSAAKKDWCCKHSDKGCSNWGAATTSEPFDCTAGYGNWLRGWSVSKKTWCCKNYLAGCMLKTTTSLPYD